MRRYPLRLVLFLACLLPFLRLGIGEVQAWDESLYTIRADACLKFGAWLDQTDYAAGHLYSATHPPFGVWLIAVSKYLLGDSTFGVRLPVAIAASLAVFLLFLFIRRVASEESALVAAVSLATADLFLLYSHRAQMECMVLCLGIASIYAIWSAITFERWHKVVLAGFLLGFGLLTKFAVVLFILPILVLLPWVLGKPKFIIRVVIAVIIAMAVALPWFIMMNYTHPDYWQHVGESFNTLAEGSYSPAKHWWWYYFNRLIVAVPLLGSIVLIIGDRALLRNKSIVASLIWLVAVVIVLQFVGTRMPHFATLLLLPGALLVGLIWNERVTVQKRMKVAAYMISFLLILWSGSEQFRLLVTGRLASHPFIIEPAGVIAAILVLCIGAALLKLGKRHHRLTVLVSSLLLAIAYGHLFSEQASVYDNGASKATAEIDQLVDKSNLIVIHPNYPHEQYAPQLAYYTHGWTLGWIPRKTVRTVMVDTAAGVTFNSQKDIAIIVRNVDRFNGSQPTAMQISGLDALLRRSFSNKREYRSYLLYY